MNRTIKTSKDETTKTIRWIVKLEMDNTAPTFKTYKQALEYMEDLEFVQFEVFRVVV
jgi:hypothetical protein